MKQLIPMDDYGIFADAKDTARANSLLVAKMFGKNHRDVLRAIKNLDCSEEFGRRNFAQSYYINEQNKKQPCVAMTRDGFTFLAMGFTGKKAAQFKEAYILRFNEMESLIAGIVTARQDYPLLMSAVKLAHEEPKPYHFSNEADMLNRIITGYSARVFREKNGIKKGASIRPFLDARQIKLIDILQKVDMGLLVSTPDYEQRKRYLEWFVMTMDKRCKLTA